jgi:hypothetical protein
MRRVATQTKEQIDLQRTEIQSLIGSRYKDVILAADKLATMHSDTNLLERILKEIPSVLSLKILECRVKCTLSGYRVVRT